MLCNQTRDNGQRQHYSLQLHPWHLHGDADIDLFIQTADLRKDDPQFVAIGECGLDALCGTPLELQHRAFIEALCVARRLHKPVIVHCVKLWSEMIHDVHSVFPELQSQPDAWRERPVIVHGYRKGTQLAQQLLDAGLSLSLGKKYNPDVAKMLPTERCYAESDEE